MIRSELLAPAGSYEGLRAAIAAGADAVYIGGQKFGARAYADNPEKDDLLDAIDFAHIHGKKVYMTVNTLLKNKELEEQLYDYLVPYYRQGLDGVIVQDYGVFSFIKEKFPEIPIHASTQMAVMGPEGAKLLKEAGASRIVTARELSLKEIRKIHEETGVEIESFIHGALCYCYSGMCLFSSIVGGRSGNRGRCAQPCRLPYQVFDGQKRCGKQKEEYPLSPKDMCTIDILPQILEAGVYSLKIEGRMKKPEYAAGVTRIYRKYLDLYEKDPLHYKVAPEDKEELIKLYHRDGFNQGYYKKHNGKDMMAVENQKARDHRNKGAGKRDEELFAFLKSAYVDKKLQEKICGKVRFFCGEPAELELYYEDHSVKITGDMVQEAENHPLSPDRIEKQMKKTGNTPFVLENLQVETDDRGFLPMQALNELRRKGIEALTEACLKPYRRELPEVPVKAEQSFLKKGETDGQDPDVYVSVETEEQFAEVLKREEIKGVYCSITMFWNPDLKKNTLAACKKAHKEGKEFYLALPYVQREGILERKEQELLELAEEIDGFLVRNLESMGYMKRLGFINKTVTDYSVYAFNDRAKACLEEFGVVRSTVPLELNSGEIRGRDNQNSEMIVYGYYPMMISAQCFKKTYGICDKKSGYTELQDRLGNVFHTDCVCDFCYNVIYNSVATGLLKEAARIKDSGISVVRMNFTTEDRMDTGRILDLFLDVYKKNKSVPGKIPQFTKGHYKRGVE